MHKNLRSDIQALRGLAVLLVLLFHAEFTTFPAGYLGVDIFFVISGFLMTGMIARGLQDGTFSFTGFYARRARRLLPAVYILLFFTIIASFFLLTEKEFYNFKEQVLGSVTFSTNLFLWKQTNYFDAGSDLKPLLHMWSLAIEEQFYLFIPVALFLLPRKFWLPAISIGVAASLALCLFLVRDKPTGTFYLLPTRAWELGIGCLGAILAINSKWQNLRAWLAWPAIIALLTIPIAWKSEHHPGLGAVIICLATIVVILSNSDKIKNALPVRALARIGDISYALYLVHWPLIAFANNIFLAGDVPLPVRVGLLLISFALAYPLYLVEERYRYASGKSLKNLIWGLVLCSFVLAALPYALGTIRKGGYIEMLRKNSGLHEKCYNIRDPEYAERCSRGSNPDLLLWGDSFAMHLANGIAETAPRGIIQMTLSSCGPFLNISHVDYPDNPPKWAEECLAFNKEVITYLRTTPSIKIVVISSPFSRPTDPEQKGIEVKDGKIKQIYMNVDRALQSFSHTVKTLRDAGKKVIVVSPPPRATYNIGICMERKMTNLWTLGSNKDCPMTMEESKQRFPYVYQFLNRVEKEADVPLVDLSHYLCDKTGCKTSWHEKSVYMDDAHLSVEGSKMLFEETDLMDEILRRAR